MFLFGSNLNFESKNDDIFGGSRLGVHVCSLGVYSGGSCPALCINAHERNIQDYPPPARHVMLRQLAEAGYTLSIIAGNKIAKKTNGTREFPPRSTVCQ